MHRQTGASHKVRSGERFTGLPETALPSGSDHRFQNPAQLQTQNNHNTKAAMKRTYALYALIPWTIAVLAAISLCPASPAQAESDGDVTHIKAPEGQLLFEIVGQVINFTPTTSTQFGYYTFIKGIDQLFAGTPENETTAWFTFYRETSNLRVTANGPLRVISREGTTTVYVNATPSSDFANPDSFRAGTPIQTSVLRQQVIVDTATGLFTVVNLDTVTSSSTFTAGGAKYRLGAIGDMFRTTKTGHLNTPGASPSGWFAGYSVGTAKARPVDSLTAATEK